MAPRVTGAPLDGSKEYEIAEVCDATPWHFPARLFCTTRRSTDGKESVAAVCDVELQAGEQVNSIHLGDTALVGGASHQRRRRQRGAAPDYQAARRRPRNVAHRFRRNFLSQCQSLFKADIDQWLSKETT
jgi:hypothetical protein